MIIFELLKRNKGTVSSALGKELAKKVLNGNIDILNEAIVLSCYQVQDKKEKHIRSGAAKIVEIVAEKKPELVAPNLEKLLPALTVDEPQTRWMIIRTFGFCARLNPSMAERAIKNADKYISKKEGLCIASSADLFLGDYGAISQENAATIFPILEKSISNVIMNEQDWLFESSIKILKNLGDNEKEIVLSFARLWADSDRKSTQTRVKKLLNLKNK
jgi:hypothetical protein